MKNQLYISKERDNLIDTLRGIAIFGVVCIHFGGSFLTSENAWTTSFYIGLVLNQLFSFSVPVFVFLSGLLLTNSRYDIKKRLRAIGIPYIIASVAAFFWLGGRQDFQVLPNNIEKLKWSLSHLFYYGIHPVFYFIPMIMMLYLLSPLLLATRCLDKKIILWIVILLLLIHGSLAILSYNHVLNYYFWCRPNPLFWLVYFYLGIIYFKISPFLQKKFTSIFVIALFVILALFSYDFVLLTDVHRVGQHFEYNWLDYAYARPVILFFNLFVMLMVGVVLNKYELSKANNLSFVGRFSLQIYLWHLFVLYYFVWKYPFVFKFIKDFPVLILVGPYLTTIFIAGFFYSWRLMLNYCKQPAMINEGKI